MTGDVESFRLGAPNAQWRLSRLEALTHSGSWVWHLADDTVEWSPGGGAGALLGGHSLPPRGVSIWRTPAAPD